MGKNRFDYIDISKGIGMICVVIGHVFFEPVSTLMFLFHMPLFFFIGGYLFTAKSNKPAYLGDKAIHLLLPYLTFLILLYPLTVFHHLNGFHGSVFLTLFVKPLFGGKLLEGYLGVFWFVTCFFLTQQIFNYLIINFRPVQLRLIMVFSVIGAYLSSSLSSAIPWNANVVLIALPIFYLGYLRKQLKYELPFIPILVCCFAAGLFTVLEPKNIFNMKEGYYGLPIITFVCSLFIIEAIFILSKRIEQHQFISRILITIGQASMVIMYLHQFVQLITLKFVSSDVYIRSLFAIFIPVLIYFFLKRYAVTRCLFLGSKADFNMLKERAFPIRKPEYGAKI
jgi:fucose 4-O-acetylase-like acetyltransferase